MVYINYKNLEEAYETLKSNLIGEGYEVGNLENIQYGIQFYVKLNKIKDIIRIYSSKKGVKLDLSQIKESYTKENILLSLNLGEKNVEDVDISKQNTYSLCIGINRFMDPKFVSLNYAENDALELHNLFVEKFGVGDGNIKLLNEKATRAEITKSLSSLAKISKPGDIVIIFIASHGEFIKSSNGPDYYLVTFDSEFNNLVGTALPMNLVKGLIANIPAQKKVLFMDTCYSGGVSRRDGSRITDELKEKIFKNFETEGFVIITSSQANQASYEHDSIKHGVFSYYLLSGMTGAVETKKGLIDLYTMYCYIYQSVKAFVNKNLKREQSPKFFASMTGQFYLPLLKEIIHKPKEKITDYIKEPLDNSSKKFKFETINCIGIDESGKGDYFGPLVTVGVYVDTESKQDQLKYLGVKDSKRIPDHKIKLIAKRIKEICGKNSYEVLWISPPTYNILFSKMGNLNEILAWAHAKSLEVLLRKNPNCHIAISDQFAGKDLLISKLKEMGKKIELIQRPKAEENIAVATASVLARDSFITILELMNKNFKMVFHKGANDDVVKDAVEFIKKNGKLWSIAKLHFTTTNKVKEILEKENFKIDPANFEIIK